MNIPALYLSWLNDFITVEKFAEHYNISVEMALAIIDVGTKTENFTKAY